MQPLTPCQRPRRRSDTRLIGGLASIAGAVGLSALTLLAQSPSAPKQTRAIDDALDSAVSRADVPGVVALVVDRRGVLYQRAAGSADSAGRRPMTADAVFRIASMTKPLTSIAAMQLVEQRRLSLDAEAGRYLPALATMPIVASFDARTGDYTLRPTRKPITIRQLMTHTSGFGYGFTSTVTRDFKPRAGDSSIPVDRSVAGGGAPLLFEPGTQWWYGTSTDWLGRIVEKVSGQTLDTYFERQILAPLAMSDTYFDVPVAKRSRVVSLHRRGTDNTFSVSAPTFQTPAVFSGGGGLSSTAPDYARFIRMVLNDGSLDGVRIVSPDTIRAMSTNQIGDVSVRALATAQPQLSADFSFVNDGRDKWGLGFLISVAPPPGRRSPGSLSWAGLNNTWFWIDRTRGIGALFMTQLLPFADPRVLSAYEAFERAVYATFGARTP